MRVILYLFLSGFTISCSNPKTDLSMALSNTSIRNDTIEGTLTVTNNSSKSIIFQTESVYNTLDVLEFQYLFNQNRDTVYFKRHLKQEPHFDEFILLKARQDTSFQVKRALSIFVNFEEISKFIAANDSLMAGLNYYPVFDSPLTRFVTEYSIFDKDIVATGKVKIVK